MNAGQQAKARSGGACELCGRYLNGFRASKHHRRPRGMGGTKFPDTAARLLVLCGTGTLDCHGLVEANPVISREAGWKIAQFDPRADWQIPVLYRGSWHLLADDGTLSLCAPPEHCKLTPADLAPFGLILP